MVGLAVYPLGWRNKEVVEACGTRADAYNLGKLRPCYLEILLLSTSKPL
jgi:hypothetical protein